MFDCCTNNRCDCGPFNNGCPPTNCCCRRSRSTEFPKQRGPYVEPKFSKYDPPSFLCNTDPPKPRVKTRSCSCSSKYPKVSINCKCKAKGISDCRKIGKDGKRVCDKSCGANDKAVSDNESPEGVSGNVPGANTPGPMETEGIPGNASGARAPGMMENGPANAIWQGPDGSSITLDNGVNPGIPVYGLMGQGNPINQNQMPQQLSEMPAAGLPTRQIPAFDPCTGRECIAPGPVAPYGQAGQSGAYGVPMTCMYPCYCPIQCYSCPPAMNAMQHGFGQPTNTMQANNFNDKETNKDKPNSRSTSKDRSERSKDDRHKSRSPDSEKSSAREREIAKASRPNRKDYQGTEIINCGSASPELIRRICDSLQGPRPPDSCYIVLPITMSSKAKDEQPEKKAKKKTELEAPQHSTIPAEEEPQKKDNSPPPPPPPVSKPTRNCGCNTLISGKFEEKSEKPEDSAAKNSCNPAAGACCSSGCCYRPCYTYCYNPCTGCFYWRKKCCCCSCSNGCCNSNNGGSCPIPKPSSNVGTPSGSKGSNTPVGSPPAKKRAATDIAKGMSAANSASDQRFSAGAMSAFQPGVQELYDQWVGFQQHAVFPPMMPPRQQPPFVNRRSRARDEPKYRSPDFDWTPQ
ncbi:hypothetical protein ACLKA6_017426 [Drosophila palustris]